MKKNYHNLHDKLIDWYERNHRVLPWRETNDPYRIWISEIMLQQTRVAQATDYYHRFINRWTTVAELAQSDEDEVLLMWQGLGYYTRARNMHKAAKMMAEKMPTSWEEWRALPGIGDYTAGAICSFAFNLPYPAMDGNVYRVIARLMDCDIAFDTTQGKKVFQQFAWDLLDTERPKLWNQAIMEFGAIYCLPQNCDCENCPIQHHCLATQHDTVALLPVRKPKAPLKDRFFHYTIFIDKNRQTLIHQRKQKDIWQHLWEFYLEETNSPSATPPLLTHILSHQRIHATFQVRVVDSLPSLEGYKTVAWEDLEQYAFAQLTLKSLQKLGLQ